MQQFPGFNPASVFPFGPPQPATAAAAAASAWLTATAATAAKNTGASWLTWHVWAVLGVLLLAQAVWSAYLGRLLKRARKTLEDARTSGPAAGPDCENTEMAQVMRAFDVVWDVHAGAMNSANSSSRSYETFNIPLEATDGSRELHACVQDKLVNAILMDGVGYKVERSFMNDDNSVVLAARLIGREHVFGADVYAPTVGRLPPRYTPLLSRSTSAQRPPLAVRAVVLGFTV